MDDQVRKWIDSIARYLPGFRGYERTADRDQSATQMRGWMLDRIEQGKRAIADCTRALVDAGKLDQLADWDRVRHQLDLQSARIRGMTNAYRGFQRQGDLDRDALQNLYDCDANLLDAVQNLAVAFEGVSAQAGAPEPLLKQLGEVTRYLDQREAYLKGYEK